MNEELWKQARGLTQKLKKQQQDNESIGEKLIGWVVISVIVLLMIALFVLPLTVYFIWSHAYVLVKLWKWFIVPLSPENINQLTLPQAWGLMMVVAFLTHVHFTCNAKDERESHEKIMAFVILFLKPWIVLLTGWVCARYFLHLI